MTITEWAVHIALILGGVFAVGGFHFVREVRATRRKVRAVLSALDTTDGRLDRERRSSRDQ